VLFRSPDSADDAIEYELHMNNDDSDSESEDDDTPERKTPKKQKFKGATVLSPKRGAYMFDPIAGLDFASLYPSIMVAYNLCHSTKVVTPESVSHIGSDNLYTTEITPERRTTFVQKGHRRGVLPQILLNLWAMRKSLKKDMARAKERGDVNLTAIYNAKQLAVKVAMNSIYGFCGADNGKLPMKEIAETVTTNGRMLIERSKAYVESWYPCEVVYGDTDSVYVRFFLDELPEHLRFPKNEADRTEMLTWVMARSQEAADRITENYIAPVELEFEKVMYPFILFKKKRYCCIIYEAGHPEKIDELCTKGIAITRRDFAPFVKRVYSTILDMILYNHDVNGAFEYAEKEMLLLLRSEYPVEDLVISRSISRKPESYANQNVPHLVLGKRIEERTGVPIKVGDRIQFVFIKGKGRQCDLVEEPHLVQQKNVDGYYYYEHQIHSSLAEIFSILDEPRWIALDAKLQRIGKQVSQNLQDISKFFSSTTTITTNEQDEQDEQTCKKTKTTKNTTNQQQRQLTLQSFFTKK
jgi:DNA polymerase delta subunit 1